MLHDLAPGFWVVSPDHPDWGLGQVQSAVGDRVTVNFEHAGKVVVVVSHTRLETVDGPEARQP